MSAAAMRRIREQLLAEAVPAPLPADVAEWLDGYEPKFVDRVTWVAIRPHFLGIVRAAQLDRIEVCKRRSSLLAGYLAWRYETGASVALAESMTRDAVEGYIKSMTTKTNKGTVNTMRSRLRKLAQAANPSAVSNPTGVAYGYAPVKPPYDPVEEAAIRRAVLRYHNEVTRRHLCLIVGMCAGAGLDAADVVLLDSGSIRDFGADGIRVDVPGPKARTVWVRVEYEEPVRAALAGNRPKARARLIGTRPNGKNAVGAIVENAVFHGHVPKVEAARLRSTWIVWALSRNVPLPVLMQAAGLKTARSLAALVEYVPAGEGVEVLR